MKISQVCGAAFCHILLSQNSHCRGAVAEASQLRLLDFCSFLAAGRKLWKPSQYQVLISWEGFLSLMWCVRDLFPRSLPHELSAAWNLFFKESELYTLSPRSQSELLMKLKCQVRLKCRHCVWKKSKLWNYSWSELPDNVSDFIPVRGQNFESIFGGRWKSVFMFFMSEVKISKFSYSK